MFIHFSDTFINVDSIMLFFKHEENGKFIICAKPRGKSYNAIAESFDTEQERDKRYDKINKIVNNK